MNKSSRYFISVDIEGITGVCADSFASKTGRNYDQARRYMASDVNAVIEGILQADPQAEIVVRDGHGSSSNLDLAQLHPRASLIQGWGTSMNMMEGLDSSFRGAFLVGYHGGASNQTAVLAHTFLGGFAEIRVNGQVINETGISAFCAQAVGVPILMVSGDDQACREAETQIAKVKCATVKQSRARACTQSLSLENAKGVLRECALTAIKEMPSTHLKIDAPYRVEVEISGTTYGPSLSEHMARLCARDLPYSYDRDRMMVTFESADAGQLMDRFFLLVHLTLGARTVMKSE